MPVREVTRNGKPSVTTISLNLAICASTLSDWLTGQREVQTFDLVLRPIYEEFIRQVGKCIYFIQGYGMPPHTKYEAFTTGNNEGVLVKQWGEHIDAIEIHDLQLTLNTRLCDRDFALIDEENRLLKDF